MRHKVYPTLVELFNTLKTNNLDGLSYLQKAKIVHAFAEDDFNGMMNALRSLEAFQDFMRMLDPKNRSSVYVESYYWSSMKKLYSLIRDNVEKLFECYQSEINSLERVA
jgi:hypothetical protein